jgi:threonine/homoserine/homoserine lactone efflux protein
MALSFFIKGILIGFSIAAPVGPIGVLCIRRSLAHGRLIGFATGFGAATADAAYGCVAGFGLTTLSNFLVGQRFWLGLVGGVFLCHLGVSTFLSRPPERSVDARTVGLFSAYSSSLLLTLTNPTTILSFIAVFAGFGLGASPDYLLASIMVLGVFLGSALWWLILSNGVDLLRSRASPMFMQTVNRISGTIILAFGLYSVAALLLANGSR